MKPSIESTSGFRRAALTLHALGHADRTWLLNQLPADARLALERLLLELGELGIPPDSTVIRTALADAVGAASASAEQDAHLCGVMQEQSPVMRSLLCGALTESQRDRVLRHWTPSAPAPLPAVSVETWAPALKDAVLRSWHELASGKERNS